MLQQSIAATLLVCLFTSTVAFAQNYPEPGSAGEPAILCTGCPGPNAAGELNDGKPLYAYDVPFVDHVGRIVDSSTTGLFQHSGMRTLRAGTVRLRSSRDRIYVTLGSTVAAYTLSTFFTGRLAEPLIGVNTIHTGSAYSRLGAPYEKLAKPDGHFYAESKYSGWTTSAIDAQRVLTDFDSDDRGYFYAATVQFGWGVHLDDGRTDGKHLPFVAQYTDAPATPNVLMVLKDGAKYAVVSSDRSNALWTYDVTTPSAAVRGATRTGSAHAITAWTKHEAGERVAVLHADGRVRIYTNAALIAGQAALAELTAPTGARFRDLSFDGDGTLWVAGTGGMWKLTPATTGYTTTHYTLSAPLSEDHAIHAGAGYVAIGGLGSDAPDGKTSYELRLFKDAAFDAPQLLSTDNYVRKHYHAAPAGYAQPNGDAPATVVLRDVHLVAQNGLTYFIYSAGGLADVYELGEVLRPPQLKVTSISPISGPPAGGTVVTVKGRNFAQGATVAFGGTAGTTTFVDSFTLTAVTPKATNGGPVSVDVTSGNQQATSPTKFTYSVAPPATVNAKATSTTNVLVAWSAAATATRYEVLRRNADRTFTTAGTTADLTFNDTGRTPDTGYVYSVRAIDGEGNTSPASASDIATTMQFTDSTIPAGMRIKAAHVLDLRKAVNLARVATGLAPATFTTSAAVRSVVVRADVQELRSAIQEAYGLIGSSLPPFTDFDLFRMPIKAIHLQQLLNAVQ